MLTLIKSVLKSLELFLSLKNKKFYYDLHKDQDDREFAITEAIEALRQTGDSNNADRADLLREQLRAERKRFEHLSTFYSKAEEE
tara:strand:- start:139 stop:393 length:255 start_codon:yes stop_codon:yes gene_type:complete